MSNNVIRISIIIASILIIVAVYFLIATNEGLETPATDLYLSDFVLTEHSFVAKATFLASAKTVRHYSYTIHSDSLYIVIKSGLANKKYSNGTFAIEINDELQLVKKVYLKYGEDQTQIYTLP